MALVFARIGDHQPQVRVDQLALGREVAPLDPLGQFHLLGLGQERIAANLLEEQRHRVGGPLREVAVGVASLLDGVATAVVAHVQTAFLQQVVHHLSLVIAKLCFLG